ncbi:hypothetical protein AA0121_g1360 [Alternaria tenuissima]|nr:hypothetical protein AA0121_g1360 [Alternaria tenuissima]
MYSLLLFTVVITVLLQPVAASSPLVDFSMSDTPIDGSYGDIDDMLCELCCLPFFQCIHAIPQAQYVAARTFYNDPGLFNMPSLDFEQTPADLAPVYEYVNAGHGQPLINDYMQIMDGNETTVQPATVQAHVEDIYTPGDRLSARRSRNRKPVQKRQAPRPGGFPCSTEGCDRTFDRQCDLNRHQKTHSTESPHVCSTCNMGFLYPKDLRRHLPTHNDPSLVVAIKHYCPYPGCDNLDGFSRKDNLLRHQRKHLRR